MVDPAPVSAALDALRRRTDGAKGHEFEELAEAFLRARFDARQTWAQVPDEGVDRFFRDGSGRTHAVQMKCLNPERAVTQRDLTQFVEAAQSADGVHSLFLLTTTDRITRNAMKVVNRHSISVVGFEELVAVDCWTGRRAVVAEPLEPRDYQREAILAASVEVDRGQIILPTGAGKSLIQAELARTMDRVLVLVPSIELVRQITGDVRRQIPRRNILAVVSSAERDDAGLPIENTTDADYLREFLAKAHRPMVISTYQSGDVVAVGSKEFTYDLAMYDEAHRTAGTRIAKKPALFKRTLTEIAARQRRFFTATPRIHSASVKDAASDHGALSYSMDNPDLYGERLYELPLKHLIEEGWLSPFDVVVCLTTRADIFEQIQANGWTDHDDPEDPTSIQDLAAAVFLMDAVRRYGVRHVLTFHSRVRKATRAAHLLNTVAHDLNVELQAMPVSANSSPTTRREALRLLKSDPDGEAHVVCNARLFTEGVNAPAIDAIMYFDYRSSPIEITQSIGRALRIDTNGTKERAHILLPVFVEDDDDAETALSYSNYRTIFAVACALRDMGVTIEQIDDIQDDPRTRVLSGTSGFTARVIVPTGWDIDLAAESLKAILVRGRPSPDVFTTGLDVLKAYVAEHPGSMPPAKYRSADGFRLGQWVSLRRLYRDQLTAEQVAELERIDGWTWDPHGDRYRAGVAALKAYVKTHGDARPPQGFTNPDGHNVGNFVTNIRNRRERLEPGQRDELEALPGWAWSVYQHEWDLGFTALQAYVTANRTTQMKDSYRTADGFRLGAWCNKRRQEYREHRMPGGRIDALEELPGWSWNIVEDLWESSYAALQQFTAEHGHASPRSDHVTRDNIKLGAWVVRQRGAHANRKLPAERQARLAALPGWVWDTKRAKWDAGITALRQYADGEGHAAPPVGYVADDGYRLGSWVMSRRGQHRLGKLPPAQVAELEALPGWRWSVKTGHKGNSKDRWEAGLAALHAYVQATGHARPPQSFVTDDGFPLGSWVSQRRAAGRQGSLPDSQHQALQELPGWSWAPHTEAWDRAASALTQYVADHGHARPPYSFVTTDGLKLGHWVSNQRGKRDKLTNAQISELESLPGWTWDARADVE